MSIKNIIKNKKILVPLIVAVLGLGGITVSQTQVSGVLDMVQAQNINPESGTKEDFNTASLITLQRQTHILYGDKTGGGHLYGTGKPCKSEFPQNWNKDKVIKEIALIAANDNIDWEKQRNGYHVAEENIGNIKVRVVKDRKNEKVITAYPTNTGRNPCPANDN